MEEFEDFDGSIGKSNAFILLSEEEEEDHHQGVTAFQSLYPHKAQDHQAPRHVDEGHGQEHHKQEESQQQHEQQQHEQQQQQQAQQHEQQPQAQPEQQQQQGEQQQLQPQQSEQAEAQQQQPRHQQHSKKRQQKEQQQKQKEQAEQEAARAAMLELQAARLPKPWSADDVNPVCLPPAATAWLLPPSYTTSTKDATEAIEAAAAMADRHTPRERKAIDLRKMSRQQLEAASFKHNLARNIEDPCQEAMEGIREHVGLVRPSCEVYPITIGGNPRVNEYSRAWNALLRGKSMVPVATPAASNGAAKAQPVAEDKKAAARPLQKEAPRTNYSAYGEYTHEQQTFNALLASYLDVPQPLVLPLLALGNPVCDLKALFLKVAKDCGGWVATCRSNKWPDIAQELQRGPQHSHTLKEIYAYYLLPVEVGMARSSGSARPASVNQWLESKVTERKNNGSEESRRPTPATVSRAVQAADEGMQSWAQDFGNSAAMPYLTLELLKQVARDPLSCSSGSALAAELRRLIQSAHGNAELAAFVTESMAKGAHETDSGKAGHAGSNLNGRGSLHGREGFCKDESSEDDGSGAFAGKGRKRGRLGANWEQQQQEQQQEQQQQQQQQQQQAQQLALEQAQQRRRRQEQQDVGGVWLEKEQQLVDAAEEEVVDKVDVLLALARSLRQKDARPPFFGASAPDVLSHFKTQFELVKGYPFRSSSQPPKPSPLTRHAQAAAAAAGASNPKQHAPTPASAATKPSPAQATHHRQLSPSTEARPMPSASRQHRPPSSSNSQQRLQSAAAAEAAAAASIPEKKHSTRQAAAKDGGRDGPGPAAAKVPSPDVAGKVSRAASEEGGQDPPVKRARGPGFGTPKCGTCHTCRNPSMKKACLTNRERMAAGKEPIIG